MKTEDALKHTHGIVSSPFPNISLVGAILFLVLSGLDFDESNGWSWHGVVHLSIFIVAIVLFMVAIVAYAKGSATNRRLDYKKGVKIVRGELTILIQQGEIQTIQGATNKSAIILPTNTAFEADCAADQRTALGAFFTTHFAENIAELKAVFQKSLSDSGTCPTTNTDYPEGTTILLPEKFAKPARILITASTTAHPQGGIVASPKTICSCIDKVFLVTRNEQIDTLYMPILGSGHGEVDKGLALMFLVLGLIHLSQHHRHIKKVFIVVRPQDVSVLKKSKELSTITNI